MSIPTLNVRKGPGLSYPVVAQIHKGEKYKLLDQSGDWYQIQVSSQKAWVANWLVNEVTSTDSDVKSGTVTVNGLRVRSGPSTSNSILAIVNKGDSFSVQETRGNWIKISIKSVTGWISSDFAELKASPISTDQREPSSNVEEPTTQNTSGIVSVSSLNVRSEPSLNARIVGALHKGDKVSILTSSSGWAQIQFGSQKAWVSNRYIESMKETVSEEVSESENETGIIENEKSSLTGTITVYSLNVRDQNSLNGKVIGKVSKGEQYPILNEQSNWYQIQLSNNKKGWVASWYVEKTISAPEQTTPAQNGKITILYNGTNIRSQSNVQSAIVLRALSGQTFPISKTVGDWYEIVLDNGTKAYVAGWIVSSSTTSTTKPQQPTQNPNKNGTLKGKTIVIDPGHGGRDNGTTGVRGTFEKLLTMKTSELLYEKLRNAGANVILTRQDDRYISLQSRVALSHYYKADAFVSVHFDSYQNSSVMGHTTYYYHNYQKELAVTINKQLSNRLNLRDRGTQVGNYHVVRENKNPAVLLELGFLSNPTEEATVNTSYFQDMAANSIYQGLSDYFSN